MHSNMPLSFERLDIKIIKNRDVQKFLTQLRSILSVFYVCIISLIILGGRLLCLWTFSMQLWVKDAGEIRKFIRRKTSRGED